MITKQNILSHELVGLYAAVEQCSDRNLTNLSGRIILETKNMISIETNRGTKRVAKSTAKKIRLYFGPDCSCSVAGSSLIGRPEDRLSKLR
jgi:ribonuclease P protein subunit POP4